MEGLAGISVAEGFCHFFYLCCYCSADWYSCGSRTLQHKPSLGLSVCSWPSITLLCSRLTFGKLSSEFQGLETLWLLYRCDCGITGSRHSIGLLLTSLLNSALSVYHNTLLFTHAIKGSNNHWDISLLQSNGIFQP